MEKNNGFSKQQVIRIFALLSFAVIASFIGKTAYHYHCQAHTSCVWGGSDFARSYSVSELLQAGPPANVYNKTIFLSNLANHLDISASPEAWAYPPTYFIIAGPLSYLPYKISFVVWTLLQLGLLLAVSYRFLWSRPWEAVILCSPTVIFSFNWGQNSVLLAALFIAAFRSLHQRPVLAGLLFGCCIIKPHLALLVPVALLAGRHYKAFIAAFTGALALIGLSVLLYGIEPWLLYRAQAAKASMMNAAISFRMPSIYNAVLFLGLGSALSAIIQILSSTLSLCQMARIARKPAAGSRNMLVQFSLLSIFALPYMGPYDFALANTAILGLIITCNPTTRFATLPLTAILAVNFIAFIYQQLRTEPAGIAIIIALMAWAYFYLCVYKRSSPASADYFLISEEDDLISSGAHVNSPRSQASMISRSS